jgi:SAM-dependent MidA family methyltransferase
MLHPPAAPPGALPEPTAEERALSAQLGARIDAEIAANHGVLPFARFMELALYAPGLGYYSGAKHKFGAAGDFVTAPELGPVFARCLARQCAEILAVTGGELLEAGAGSGALAAELLLELERLGRLPPRYLILELSAALRAHQQATLHERAPHLAGRVTWLDGLPAPGFRGVVLGNELLDALPVERFRVRADGIARLAVGREHQRFVWREIEADAGMHARLASLGLPPGYESEIGLAAEGWVRSLADVLEHGVLLLIDYGFPRGEFYHPQRAQGTLMCHYRHRAHTDPLILVGLQDITAHVDFSAIAQAGAEAGLAPLGYASQSMFLLGCGLEEVMADMPVADARAQLTLAAEVKKLTLPHEMGELFKAIALGRGIETPLRGFRFQDRRAALGITRS